MSWAKYPPITKLKKPLNFKHKIESRGLPGEIYTKKKLKKRRSLDYR